jgi:hypothetical protein
VPGIGSSARRPLRLPRPAFQKALRRFSGSTNCLKQFPMHARFVLFVSFCNKNMLNQSRLSTEDNKGNEAFSYSTKLCGVPTPFHHRLKPKTCAD